MLTVLRITVDAMLPKENLIIRLQRDRQTLLATLTGVPDEALATPGANGSWSAMDILAHLTAWDGEAMRRMAFATGDSSTPPHDLDDEAHWQQWNVQQIEMKRLLGPRGVKVDLAGTWVRLMARIEALSPLDYARWLEIGSGIRLDHDREHTQQLRDWRDHWERSLPWWRRVGRDVKNLFN